MEPQSNTNPEYAVEKRAFYAPDTQEYNQMLNFVCIEFSNKSNPSSYCPIHHSVETRTSIEHHKNPSNNQEACIPIYTSTNIKGNLIPDNFY